MIAVLDIFAMAPDFKTAVNGVHDATTPVALVICFAGLVMCVQRALLEKSVGTILPALIQITIVSLIIGYMPAIGGAIEQAVVDIEQSAGVGNVSAFTQYTQVIKTKYGVDISALNGLVPNNGPVSAGQAGSMLTSYGQPNDQDLDSASAQGKGAFAPFLDAHSLIAYQNPSTPASAALSPDQEAKYNVAPGQAFTVTTSTGQTLNLIFSDRTRADLTGRVDIYDPQGNLTASNGLGSSVSNFTLGAPMASTTSQNPMQSLGSWANSLLHPAEAAQSGIFGLVVLLLSYIALALEWLAALVQSVLYYSEIAVSGLFVGFLLVPGLQNIAKGFLLSFVAIALAPIAFMIVGLLTKLIISIGLNASNNNALGSANVGGLSYFWLVVLAIVAGTGSILGPWMLGKQIIRGASGMADLLVGSLAVGRGVFSAAAKGASAVVSGGAAAAGGATAASGGSRRFP